MARRNEGSFFVRRSAFVDNGYLIEIAVVAVWIASALPIFHTGLRFLARRGEVGLGERLLLILVAFLIPWLFLKGIVGLEWLVERLVRVIRERRTRSHRE